MKKLKRFTALLLASLTLSFSVGSSFCIPKVEAVAPTSYAFFYTFVQYMMASQGLSMTSTADNEALARDFNYWLDSQVIEAKNEVELAKARAVVKGQQFFISDYLWISEMWDKYRAKYINAKASKIAEGGSLDKAGIQSLVANYYGGSSSLDSWFSGSQWNFANDKNFNYVCIQTVYCGSVYNMFISFAEAYPSNTITFRQTSSTDNPLDVRFFDSNGKGQRCIRTVRLTKSSPFGLYTSANFINSYGSVVTYSDMLSAWSWNNNTTFFSCSEMLSDDCPEGKYQNYKVYTPIDTAIQFDDLADVQSYAEVDSIAQPYGDYTKALPIPATSVTAGSEDIVRAIESAISSSGSDLTSEDINKIVSDSISSVTGSIDSLNDSVDENGNLIVNNTSVLNDILVSINEIKSKINAPTDGSSALEIDDIKSQFEVIEGGGGNEPEPDDDPKIWLPIIPPVVKFLKPALEFIGKPLSEITKFLKKISDTIIDFANSVKEFITEFPLEFPEYLKHIQEFLENFPIDFPDILHNIQEILSKFPDMFTNLKEWLDAIKEKIPFAPDLTWLQELLEAIKGKLEGLKDNVMDEALPDSDAIADTVADLNSELANKYSLKPFNDFILVLKGYKFGSDYPVISMQTPAIILQANASVGDRIILFNGKDFAVYFQWVRRFLSASFIVGYAYAFIRKFKVRLTI